MTATEELLHRARECSLCGDEPGAQQILVDLLHNDPHNSSALYMLGGSYYCSEKYPEAVVIFEQLVLMFPGDGKASTGLYNALWSLNKATEAVTEIRRFLETANPKLERDTILSYLQIIETLNADDSHAPN